MTSSFQAVTGLCVAERYLPLSASRTNQTLSETIAKMKHTIAIISIGEMGLGVSRLLKAHGYRVVTNVSDRRSVSAMLNSVESLRASFICLGVFTDTLQRAAMQLRLEQSFTI